MSDNPRILKLNSLKKTAQRFRSDLEDKDCILLYAYNGTGKTRLSMEFKEIGKKRETDNLITQTKDTLYFNAYTEDLFSWENDFEGDSEHFLNLKSSSQFFNGFKELAIEPRIKAYLYRYCEIDFEIQYETWRIIFSKGEQSHIKISRGEENIFIWCIFLAICERDG